MISMDCAHNKHYVRDVLWCFDTFNRCSATAHNVQTASSTPFVTICLDETNLVYCTVYCVLVAACRFGVPKPSSKHIKHQRQKIRGLQ